MQFSLSKKLIFFINQ